jgi:hypothetical protein
VTRLILALIIVLAWSGIGLCATTTFNVAGNASVSGNWSGGLPSSSTDCVIAANCNIDTSTSCKTFTVNSGVTLSGSSALTMADAPTVDTGSTITYNGAITLNAAAGTTVIMRFGGKTWGNLTINLSDGALAIFYDYGENTFSNLTVTNAAGQTAGTMLGLYNAGLNVTGTFTFTGKSFNYLGGDHGGPCISVIRTGTYSVSQNTITAGAVSITGPVNFFGIKGAGAASWDLSGTASGDQGGNSGITFRSPQTWYVVCGTTDSCQDWYQNVYSTSTGGATSATNYVLPQDTVILDNNSWTNSSGLGFYFHHQGGCTTCNFDASAVTKSATIAPPVYLYGNLNYTGAGLTMASSAYTINNFDPRVKYERSGTLDINVPISFTTPITISQGTTVGGATGTVKLTGNFTSTSAGTALTLGTGTLDINGKILTSPNVSMSGSENRTLADSTGGGKIVLTGTTGTLFDTTTATNLTVSNSPSIQIGDGTKTITGEVTFMGAGKTWGALTIAKHAGNYSTVVSGTNQFGRITLDTPDSTYQYTGLKLPPGVTTTASGLTSIGTASYPNTISATSAATLSVAAGNANPVAYSNISYITATGGSVWTFGYGSTDSGNNTGLVRNKVF